MKAPKPPGIRSGSVFSLESRCLLWRWSGWISRLFFPSLCYSHQGIFLRSSPWKPGVAPGSKAKAWPPAHSRQWFLGISHCLAGSHVASRSSNYCSSVSTSWWLQGLLLQVSTSWMLYLSAYACLSRFWARGLPFNITFLMKPRKVFGSCHVELLRMDGMMASKLFTCRI